MTSGTAVRSAPARVAGVTAVAVAALALVDPSRTHVPLCPFHAATGHDCPLCGSLRSVHELTRGALGAAARDNLLLVIAIPVVVVAWLLWFVDARAGRVRSPRRWSRAATITTVAAMLVFTLIRNLPFAAVLRPA